MVFVPAKPETKNFNSVNSASSVRERKTLKPCVLCATDLGRSPTYIIPPNPLLDMSAFY